MNDERTAAERIREIRKLTGLSQGKFSEAYGIPKRTLEDWEEGRRNPPEYVIRMLDMWVRKETDA